ncbi:hypothetical protein Bca4012_055519 [Brassica carinata]
MEIPRHKLKSAEMTQLELLMFVITRRGLSTRSLLNSLNCLMSFLRFLMPVIPWHALYRFIIICHLHNHLHCLWP